MGACIQSITKENYFVEEIFLFNFYFLIFMMQDGGELRVGALSPGRGAEPAQSPGGQGGGGRFVGGPRGGRGGGDISQRGNICTVSQ